ncbi:MAG: helix-turn-helix transcriptional regulator [Deinococcales bacterium]|nr:helix-turn-helix transcriptional regulator [Deinococcales bacterium]
MTKETGIKIITADDSFATLVRPVVDRVDTSADHWTNGNFAHVLLDFPLTWAISQLTLMNSVERARTVVATQASHPAYHDMLASFHVSSVVGHADANGLITGIYAAASALKTYQWRSGLTYMELRVTRLLVQGYDTARAAESLRVTQKTINAHVSNILTKLGYETRAQYVAALIAHHAA